MRSLISIAVLLGAVTVIGQEVQPPAISAIYDGVSSKDIQRELDFLQVGLHPAFGPAHPGGGGSFGVYHRERREPDSTPPVRFYAPAAVYPAGVLSQGEVNVRVWFIIWLDGTPQYVRVLGSAGEPFDTAGVLTVRRWRYYPGAKAGRVWLFDTTADVTFRPAPYRLLTGAVDNRRGC